MAAFGNADPGESLLQGGTGCGQVGSFVIAALQGSLGFTPGLLGPLEVDIGGEVRCLSHDDDTVRPNLQEATEYREMLLRSTLADGQLAGAQGRDQGRVVGQNAELPFTPG
jgi:hypothetical protein